MRPRPRDFVFRLLLTIGLLAPATLLFVGLNTRLNDQQAGIDRELLGVEYLRSLTPLAAALAQAQAAAVTGDDGATRSGMAALDAAVAETAAVDDRLGDALGTKARWRDLRTRIAALPDDGDPRTLFTTYRDVGNLLRALIDRVGELSGLANDAETDSYYLHRSVTADLPQLLLAAGRLVDLAVVSKGNATKPTDLGDLIALRREASQIADRLDADVQAAASATARGLPTTTVYGTLETVRTKVGQFLGAADPVIDGEINTAEVAAASGARTQLTTASSALSGTVFTELVTLISERHDTNGRDQTLAMAAFGLLIVLALVPTVLGVGNRTRRRNRQAWTDGPDRPPFELGTGSPEWTRAEPEPVRAAR